MDIEMRFRQLLLPVLGIDVIDDVKPEQSLVDDLGADSLDFVDMLHQVEVEFGVSIGTNEILLGDSRLSAEEVFEDSKLTADGLSRISEVFPDRVDQLRIGMSRFEFFRLLTVRDVANIIQIKLQKGKTDA
jgi:acyl carrier protein